MMRVQLLPLEDRVSKVLGPRRISKRRGDGDGAEIDHGSVVLA